MQNVFLVKPFQFLEEPSMVLHPPLPELLIFPRMKRRGKVGCFKYLEYLDIYIQSICGTKVTSYRILGGGG
jgi:hypothetical protein